MTPNSFRFGNDEYEIAPKHAVVLSRYLTETWEKLGKPTDVFSDSGKKMMEVIVASWMDLFPQEAKAWIEERKAYQDSEMTISEQVRKKTGRSLCSVPFYIYKIMKKMFPEIKIQNRKTAIRFVQAFPMFRLANKV